jgi:DNA-binding GntR family transcriptional regulator
MRRPSHNAEAQRRSLVDSAEEALRTWLVPGRHRPGDRLPPEHEVAATLGISRGTLRTALQRLEETGEIVRRQGSGTFVGRILPPSHLDERLERLEPYSSLAERLGVKLAATRLRIEQRPVGREAGKLMALDPSTHVTTISRVLLADESPAAVMFDVVHPAVELPDTERLERRLEDGQMVLDVLIELGVAVAFARTRVMPCLVTPRGQVGKALGAKRTTAALELEEVIYAGGGDPVAYSRDLFAPGALDVQVIRRVDAASPMPITPSSDVGRRSRAARASRDGGRATPARRRRRDQLQG